MMIILINLHKQIRLNLTISSIRRLKIMITISIKITISFRGIKYKEIKD